MKFDPIAAEVLRVKLAHPFNISELLLSASGVINNDRLLDWGAEVERLYNLLSSWGLQFKCAE